MAALDSYPVKVGSPSPGDIGDDLVHVAKVRVEQKLTKPHLSLSCSVVIVRRIERIKHVEHPTIGARRVGDTEKVGGEYHIVQREFVPGCHSDRWSAHGSDCHRDDLLQCSNHVRAEC